MKKSLGILLLALLVVVWFPKEVSAKEIVSDSKSLIGYDYSETVTAETIRYISQVPTGSLFHEEYWPEKSFGSYTGSTRECKTSCISMALSYLGIDRTPAYMLLVNNGVTKTDGWGADYQSVDIDTGMKNYKTGKGTFSPVLIHLSKYSGNGHYVLLVDNLSENTYQVLDPWECAVTSIEVSGNNATYAKSGKIVEDTIDVVGQWYLYNASLENQALDVDVPKAVCGLKVTPLTSTDAKLSWKKQSDVTGYKVYQKEAGQKYKLVKDIKKNTCKVYVQTDKKYIFKVIPYIKYDQKIVKGKAKTFEFFSGKSIT